MQQLKYSVQKGHGVEIALPSRAERCGDLFQAQQRRECPILPSRHTRKTSSPCTAHTEQGKPQKKKKNVNLDISKGEKLSYKLTQTFIWIIATPKYFYLQFITAQTLRGNSALLKEKLPTSWNQQVSKEMDGNSGSVVGG